MAKCNICGSARWRDEKAKTAFMCAECHSRDRTRVMRMFLGQAAITSETRILHIAPEKGLANYLSAISDNYMAADIETTRYKHIVNHNERVDKIHFVDLCDRSTLEKFGDVDLIIHSHVMEHVPCNVGSALLNLHNMLRPGGMQIFAFPIKNSPGYAEYLGPMTAAEAEERFGQFDHVRQFSSKDLDRTLGSFFVLPKKYDLLDDFTKEELEDANVRPKCWKGFTGNTVFRMKKEDCLF